jgi:adenosylcobinamide-phosphate synthase
LTTLDILLVALVAESAFGYPQSAFRAAGHPVVWIGALIGWLDRRFNSDRDSPGRRRTAGVLALGIVLLAVAIPTGLLQAVLLARAPNAVAVIALGLMAATLPAQRSLAAHVRDVADALESGGIAGGRVAVARIVGRNPETLDEAGVVRAAIESLAENFSDGVVAPAVWCAIAGLPGIACYKAVNTADSMIGHRTTRHAAFGWAAARLDDAVNLPASRLTALWLVIAAALTPGASAAGAWRAMRRDARRHRSPNAGWPEAAMAGALGLRLAGPRVYGAVMVEDAWMGDGRPAATIADIRRALSLYRLACAIQIVVVLALAITLPG